MNGRLEDLGVFTRRIYCDQKCMGQGAARADVSRSAHLWRARRHRKAACEQCGATAKLHVHHDDGNWKNDHPSNLVTLCDSCHLRLHWSKDEPHVKPRRVVLRGPFERLLELVGEVLPLIEGTDLAEQLEQAIKDMYGAKDQEAVS